MHLRWWKRLAVLAVLATVVMGVPSLGQAGPTVELGWDLFETQPGTSFMGIPFTGVPLGSFDFGPGIGVKATGTADTIVERLAVADAPSEVIPIELVALHLMSAVPGDFGLGLGTYFITLQAERGGPASTGSMTINFGPEPPGPPPAQPVHGTFDSFFDVFFDVRLGGLNGPIALSSNQPMTSAATPWSHFPPGSPANPVIIEDVNFNLNGPDQSGDFWPVGTITEQHPSPAVHVVGPAQFLVPEPSSLTLLALGVIGAWAARRRRGRGAV